MSRIRSWLRRARHQHDREVYRERRASASLFLDWLWADGVVQWSTCRTCGAELREWVDGTTGWRSPA